jgi:hypothetical protein
MVMSGRVDAASPTVHYVSLPWRTQILVARPFHTWCLAVYNVFIVHYQQSVEVLSTQLIG